MSEQFYKLFNLSIKRIRHSKSLCTYKCFKDQVCHYMFWCCILSVSTVTPEEPALAGIMLWYIHFCWISIAGAGGGVLECLVEQCPSLPRAKNEGQPSLITTLKHYQHLFKPKTTLSPEINLLYHWIITLTRVKLDNKSLFVSGSSERHGKPYFTANSVRRLGLALYILLVNTDCICMGNKQTINVNKHLMISCNLQHLSHSGTNGPWSIASENKIFWIWTWMFLPCFNETLGLTMRLLTMCKMPFTFAL